MSKVLIAKKTEAVAKFIAEELTKAGHETELVLSAKDAILKIVDGGFDAVLTGLSFNDDCGQYDKPDAGIGVAHTACDLGIKNVVLISSIPDLRCGTLPDGVKIWSSTNWGRANIKRLLDMIK